MPWVKGNPSHRKGRTLEEEYGIECAKQIRQKLRFSHLGQIPWNKGKKGVFSEETRKLIGDAWRGKAMEQILGEEGAREFKRKVSLARKRLFREGKLVAPKMFGERNPAKRLEVRKVLSERKMGDKNPMKRPEVREKRRRTYFRTLETTNLREKISKRTTEAMQRPEVMKKMKRINKLHWENPEYIKAQMRAREVRPNKLELKLNNLLQTQFPNEWKYVGDGEVIIGGICPDWANVNGEKKLIDLFGCFYHGCPIHNPNWKPRPRAREDVRRKIFSNFGYDYLVIWEHELNELPVKELTNKIEGF